MSLVRKIFSHFPSLGQVLFEGQGLYSVIKVIKKGGRINLYTGKGFLQSSISRQETLTGVHSDWFLAAPWLSGNFEGNLDSLLILGLGAGSEVPLYNQAYKVKKITGVEIDPLIIDLGKKYFDLNETNVKTINGNVRFFLDTMTDTYDQIILDLFKENVFEKDCQSLPFFQKVRGHLTPEGVLLANRVLKDPSNSEMERELKKVFNTVVALRIRNNLFVIATNARRAPKSPVEVQQLLLKASTLSRQLRFFGSLKLEDIRVISDYN